VGFLFVDCWIALNPKICDFRLILGKEQLRAKSTNANQFISAVGYRPGLVWEGVMLHPESAQFFKISRA